MSVATRISEGIFENGEFRNDFISLTKRELWSNGDLPLEEPRIKRLIESAAILSLSTDERHKKLAYKIVIYLFRQYIDSYNNLPLVAQLVLARLGDLPSISHMVDSDKTPDYFSFVHEVVETTENASTPSDVMFPEIIGKKVSNRAQIAGRLEVNLTDFQVKLLSRLEDSADIAFSAPTSAGKSFLILNYLADRLSKASSFTAIYLVPTKALMAEVQASTYDTAKKIGLVSPEFIVLNSTSVLNYDEIVSIPKKVLVLTQERLQEMLATKMTVPVDLMILDEAQKVGDDDRGIVTEDSVQELVRENPDMQKVIISPYIKNLLKYAEIFDIPKDKVVTESTRKSPVGQSILFVTFQSKTRSAEASVRLSTYIPEFGITVDLGTPSSANTLPKSIYERKAWVAKNLIKDRDPTIIYCDGPAQCRAVGRSLIRHFNVPHDSPDVADAIGFLKEHVHPSYYLAELLQFGVGYHYGKMPQFIRFFVKRLFEDKKIEFLCCTSTLLEGVNLPAKNLVIYKPKAGEPMSVLSIKNLIGRAGRLQKDYYGKIYCVNVAEWAEDNAPFKDELETVSSASEDTLLKNADELTRYLEKVDSIRIEDRTRAVRTLATTLLMRKLLRPNVDPLQRYRRLENVPTEALDRINVLLDEILAKVSPLNRDVILRNRSIDPRFQFELYDSLRKGDFPLPLAPGQPRFYDELFGVFKLIVRHLMRFPIEKQPHVYYTFLANKWIGQASYKEMLDGKIEHDMNELSASEKAELKDPERYREFVNKKIEKLDDELEETIKYDLPRMLRCYIDISDQVLREKNQSASFCRELPIYLEAGASQPSVLLLLEAGLSRNTAIAISEQIPILGLKPPSWKSILEVTRWLQENKESLKGPLHAIYYNEMVDLLG